MRFIVDAAYRASWLFPMRLHLPAVGAPRSGARSTVLSLNSLAPLACPIVGSPIHRERSSMNYVVLQVILKEKMFGTGSGNLTELEKVLNAQAALGYRLHTITSASSGSKGLGGGDRIQATLVFEKL
jgi:hypothetical protein